MPGKYSHAKKRAARKPPSSGHGHHSHSRKESHRPLDPLIDRSLTHAMTALSDLERCISRILLLRYEQDIARLFSTRLYCISLIHLPTIMMRCMTIGGPGWIAHNADCEDIKDFFRSAIAMDMRQAGERVATKSVLWSYTVLRHFAISNGVSVCRKRGLHSIHLLPHYAGLKAHLDALEAQPPPTFSKPAHLGPLTDGLDALEEACSIADSAHTSAKGGWDASWRPKLRLGYERLVQTLWRVAHEFDPRGYGLVLREKLTNNWCECGCSTDHLGEVCERAVSEDEQENGVRSGKQREWDGRGSGVFGWGTDEEEDIWEAELDFVGTEPPDDNRVSNLSIGERMEWRYLRAEKEKELGNAAFKKGDFGSAIKYYVTASKIEPEMPHYQLNLAAAHLKLDKWIEAETACDKALNQHRSSKGYYRRARARKMQGNSDGAIKDLRAALHLQPSNTEALKELVSLIPLPMPEHNTSTTVTSDPLAPGCSSSSSASPGSSSAPGAGSRAPDVPNYDYLHLPRVKPPKALPFSRTDRDGYRLKISPVPLTLDVPVDMSLPFDKSNLRAKVQVKPYSFSYPSWERYMVQKVS